MGSADDPNLNYLETLISRYQTYRNLTRASSVVIGITQVVLATLVPVVLLLPNSQSEQLLAALFGAGSAVAKGVDEIAGARKAWIRNSRVFSRLTNEKILYVAGATPYNVAESKAQRLASRVTDILGQENEEFIQSANPQSAANSSSAPAVNRGAAD